ncbi:unnamed protein product [Urochloa decumbens]|uniref:VWFA domain-containing protein n=1 Tax=Urochloa decumbens TaxID=240449 RepID=A0ABC9C102_9POAL
MAFTTSMSGRRWPVFLAGIGHAQKIFTAEYSNSAQKVYDDDDPVEQPAADAAAGNGVLVLKTHCEYPTIPNGAEHEGFVVMVTVKAPALVAGDSGRAPVDLVVVLDAGASMAAGAKLEQVKRAMAFVIDSLGPRDRLSAVAFDPDEARQVLPLTRMSEDSKAAAKRGVESLNAAAGTGTANVRGGLDEAAKVLDGNQYAAVILLTDGQGYDMTSDDHSGHVPPFFTRTYQRTPVHTFMLSSDGNGEQAAAAMYHISEATGGTFTFVEDHAIIQDAFARCVGGLRSLAAEGVWIDADCQYPGVTIRAVKSGRHESRVEEFYEQVTVNVGDLYADEERRFLFLFDVDSAHDAKDTATHLMKLSCNYGDKATHRIVDVYNQGPWVRRPLEAGNAAPDMEVKQELLRVAAAEDMALARAAAERGAYAEAVRILDARRELLTRSSAPGMAGDAVCKALVAELRELSVRVADEQEYKLTGRACVLAAMSAHAQQRGWSVPLFSRRPVSSSGLEVGCSGSAMFATPEMRKMEKLSEMLRKRQQQLAAPVPPPLLALPQKNGSKVVARSRLEARLAAAAPHLSMLRRYRSLLPLKR